MLYQNRITCDLQQCGGKPCIRGLRVRGKDILEMLAGGMSESEILEDYGYLESENIRAALEYAQLHDYVMVSKEDDFVPLTLHRFD